MTYIATNRVGKRTPEGMRSCCYGHLAGCGAPLRVSSWPLEETHTCGAVWRARLYALLKRINAYLVRWAANKYRRLASFKRAEVVARGRSATTRAVRALALDARVRQDQATQEKEFKVRPGGWGRDGAGRDRRAESAACGGRQRR